MSEGKARIEETDIPEKMQTQNMACASHALDLFDVFDCISIAAHIKKVIHEFDKMYGSGWQYVVGSNFGTFIYFALETHNFLIFKGATS
ncbi:dynein light chain lc6 [Quercus suber]|uniref:Dynein light chain n=1 Tax=Quercus suber TaxID=58331 RepID=A0AAW0JDA0_QUESU